MIVFSKFGSRGALGLVALLFLSAAGLRILDAFGSAMALEAEEPVAEAGSAPLQCAEPPERLLEAIRARDGDLAAREAALQDRIAALALSEQAITARIAELSAAEEKLRATLAIADKAAENDVARLTTVYEAMKPADAAKLFETMEPEFAAGFLARMQPQAAAAILSGMTSDAAYTVSVLIAGRNAAAPTE